MGSKISFSRGNSEQNALSPSELTSLPCDPLAPFHAPVDGKQMAEKHICQEEDCNYDLPSKLSEHQGVKDTDQHSPDALLECLEADGLSNSLTVGEVSWQHSERSKSAETMETESLHAQRNPLASATDVPGQPVAVRRKRGRPPKKKMIPVKKNQADSSACDEKPVESIPVHPKKRGRPRKVLNPVPKEETPDPFANLDVERDIGPAQRLRSRMDPVTPVIPVNINPLSEGQLVPEQSDPAATGNKKISNGKGLKRGRPRSSNRQTPAQGPGCAGKEELASGTDAYPGQIPEVDERGKQKVDVNHMEESNVTQSRSRKPRRRKRGRKAFQRRTLPPKMTAGSASEMETSACHSSLVDPQTEEALYMNGYDEFKLQSSIDSSNVLDDPKTEIVNSPRHTQSHKMEIPVNVKAEGIEIELDDFSISESNVSSQHNPNTIIKSEHSSTSENRETEIAHFTTTTDELHINSRTYNTSTVCRKSCRSVFGLRRRTRKQTVTLQGELLEPPMQECDGQVLKDNGEPGAYPNGIPRRRRGKVKCKDCGKLFKFYSHYIIHHRTHTGERPYKCEECGKCFHKSSNLNLHVKTHSRQRTNAQSRDAKKEASVASEKQAGELKCKYCGKIFRFRSALVRHMRVHTGEKPFKCNICGQGFGQSYAVYIHELTHWSVKCYSCTVCGKSFTDHKNARDHYCLLDGKQDALLAKRKQARASLSYTCHICSKTFFHLKEFTHHFKAHTGSKFYRCLFCDKIFAILSDFNAHRSFCKRTSGESHTSCSVKNEVTNESGQISFSRFSGVMSKSSPLSLQKQKETSSKKPFQSTSTPSQNLSHLVSKLNKLDNRSDPRKYLCPSCGRLFRHMGRLRAHMLSHPRGQSYPCSFCGKTLENWNKLWHHQRIHRQKRGRFTCPQCGQGFRFVGAYKRHMAEHPEFHWVHVRPKKAPLPYQCEQCNASFRTLDILFSHQRCHSSLQDTQKKSGNKLAVDDNTHSIRKVISLPTNHNLTTKSELRLHNVCRSQTGKMNGDLNGGLFSKRGNAVPAEPRSDKQPSSTRLCKEKKNIPEENVLGKPIINRQVIPAALGSNACEGSSEAIKCALCGSAYSAISDLYQHYLQHARGQL